MNGFVLLISRKKHLKSNFQVTHNSLPSPWEMEAETQNYLVKAVVGLLQEAVPFGSGKSRDQEEAHRRTLQVGFTNFFEIYIFDFTKKTSMNVDFIFLGFVKP